MGRAYVRRYPRLGVRMAVDYTADSESYHSMASNVGGGGLFLVQVEGLEPEKEISVRFRPAKHLPLIQAKARVRFVIPGQGAGIEFTEISEADRQKLLRLILQRTGDRRLQRRGPLATQVQCEECMTLAFSRDISAGGMFIETTAILPVGSILTVRFNLNNPDRAITATAHVAYQVEKMGLGILFSEIGPEDREAIEKYLETAPHSPKRGSPHAPAAS